MTIVTTTIQERVQIANQFIRVISDHGRRFFYNKEDGVVAHFKLKGWRIYFVDDWTKKEIYLHYRYWQEGFSHGGTMRQLVNQLKGFIQGKRPLPMYTLGPWPKHLCDGDLWGYGDDMQKVREQCNSLTQ